MVVLAREVGLPARLVNGFAGGRTNEIGGFVVVAQSDAHAWVEIHYERAGWVRYDPTPADLRARAEPPLSFARGSPTSRARSSSGGSSAWWDSTAPIRSTRSSARGSPGTGARRSPTRRAPRRPRSRGARRSSGAKGGRRSARARRSRPPRCGSGAAGAARAPRGASVLCARAAPARAPRARARAGRHRARVRARGRARAARERGRGVRGAHRGLPARALRRARRGRAGRPRAVRARARDARAVELDGGIERPQARSNSAASGPSMHFRSSARSIASAPSCEIRREHWHAGWCSISRRTGSSSRPRKPQPRERWSCAVGRGRRSSCRGRGAPQARAVGAARPPSAAVGVRIVSAPERTQFLSRIASPERKYSSARITSPHADAALRCARQTAALCGTGLSAHDLDHEVHRRVVVASRGAARADPRRCDLRVRLDEQSGRRRGRARARCARARADPEAARDPPLACADLRRSGRIALLRIRPTRRAAPSSRRRALRARAPGRVGVGRGDLHAPRARAADLAPRARGSAAPARARARRSAWRARLIAERPVEQLVVLLGRAHDPHADPALAPRPAGSAAPTWCARPRPSARAARPRDENCISDPLAALASSRGSG